MLQVIERCFPNEFASWRKPLVQIVPSFGTSLNANPKQAKESLAQTAKTLKLR
jgi:malate dehydrogenase (quinone)